MLFVSLQQLYLAWECRGHSGRKTKPTLFLINVPHRELLTGLTFMIVNSQRFVSDSFQPQMCCLWTERETQQRDKCVLFPRFPIRNFMFIMDDKPLQEDILQFILIWLYLASGPIFVILFWVLLSPVFHFSTFYYTCKNNVCIYSFTFC